MMDPSTLANGLDPPTQSAPGPTGKILLVEDQLVLAKMLTRQLERQGHTVAHARDGIEALGKLQTFDANLIISDWVMEPLDGIEFCRRLRSDPQRSHIYFLLLTARDRLEDRLSAFQAGIDEYVTKPVVDQELLQRVRVGLRINCLQRELALSNAMLSQSLRRIREEIELVGRLQRSLLPSRLPSSQFECAVVYNPCEECGGDYYDFIPLSDDRIAIVMADVSGHGAPAMVAMAIIRSLLHGMLPGAESPEAALRGVNSALWHHLPTEQYATMFIAFWDRRSGRLRSSSAGHCAPLVIRRSTGRAEPLEFEAGFPIKLIGAEIDYSAGETNLAPGDRLVLFTDGLVEAFNAGEEQFGLTRLVQTLEGHAREPVGELRRRVLEAVTAFCGDHPQEDDQTLLLLEVR
jgi:sigma-B regulation protein RsbU (phosphoserine phosphatase)